MDPFKPPRQQPRESENAFDTCCCFFNRHKWAMVSHHMVCSHAHLQVWSWLTSRRGIQPGIFEYTIPPKTTIKTEKEEEIDFYRQQTYGAQSGEFQPDQMKTLGRNNGPTTIQSYGRLSFDQYCLLAKKILGYGSR